MTAAIKELDRRSLGVLSGGHCSVDLCQGAVPALLPFLIADRHYSYAAAGMLVLAATIGSSLVQPLFGALSDRLTLPWLMPVGPFVAGTGVALIGVMPSFALTLIVTLVSGLGVAAFHPEGSRFANYVSAKGAQLGLTRSWARELAPTGITVNLVAPGWIPTERHADATKEELNSYAATVPMKRMGIPEDVAKLVAFLASDAARFITGQRFSVNGGNTLA